MQGKSRKFVLHAVLELAILYLCHTICTALASFFVYCTVVYQLLRLYVLSKTRDYMITNFIFFGKIAAGTSFMMVCRGGGETKTGFGESKRPPGRDMIT